MMIKWPLFEKDDDDAFTTVVLVPLCSMVCIQWVVMMIAMMVVVLKRLCPASVDFFKRTRNGHHNNI